MTTALTAVVVDDEQRARSRLVRLLEAWPNIQVVAQASGGLEAVELIERLDPSVIFLDVQMPDLDGFGVLRKLSLAPRYVVFTTAYDSYAMDAFEVGAVDYLLKPFGEREVGRAVAWAMERSSVDEFRKGYQRLLEALDRPRYSESLPVTYLKNIVLLPVSEITHFEADQELVAIHALGQQYSTDLTLTELERRLDPRRFFRVHRRAIVNLDRLIRLEPLHGGRYLAVLGDGARVEVSRAGSRRLREHLGL